MARLRPVVDDTEILTRDEIVALGNERFAQAREAVMAAIHAGTEPGWFQRESLSHHDLERLRDAARAASVAWSRAEGLLTEITNEVDRAKRAARITTNYPSL